MSAQETSLTDLLNSLHRHLQYQLQLLPTLHLQLGLHPGALEDDFRALHAELLKGIEGPVGVRRKEVEDWMTRCDTVERECIRYSEALGDNAQSGSKAIEELRSDPVLPRRYNLMAEHQEKLRQLYHSKLEHLATIINRLRSLARTLGSTYFSTDLLEPSIAPRENVLDPESYHDVSPDRFLKLEKELARGKAEVAHRLVELGNLFVQIDWLYSELGISPPTLDSLGSSSGSPFFHPIASPSNALSDPFLLETPTPLSRTSGGGSSWTDNFSNIEHQRTFARFILRLEEAGDEDFSQLRSPPCGLENVEPNPGLVSWAKCLQASLEDIKRKRESHIQSIYDQLESLWRRLGVDETAMDAFVENHRGSTDQVVHDYEEELERMLKLKKECMGTFIDSAREEINKLWDDLMIGDDERADFVPFVDSGDYTEELLTIHEDEIRRLVEERRLKAPLLASVRKYFDICKEEKELAMAAADQTRLLGRGPRDPGRLLREEKMRKRVLKEKPRLEQDLLISIPAWEQATSRPFLVHGESFLPLLMEAVAAADQENKRRSRAGSVSSRATTPVNSSNTGGRAPSSRAITPALERNSSTSQFVSNKRQKLNSGRKNIRAPLGNHRGNDMQTRPEPPMQTPGGRIHSSSRSRHLGHGRTPSAPVYSSELRSVSAQIHGSHIPAFGRPHNTSKSLPGVSLTEMRKSSRPKRESFKPRPIEDPAGIGIGKSSKRCGTLTGR